MRYAPAGGMIGATMICPACGTDNRPGQRFCGAAAPLGAGEPQVAGLIDEARTVLGRLGAAPILARLGAATGAPA